MLESVAQEIPPKVQPIRMAGGLAAGSFKFFNYELL